MCCERPHLQLCPSTVPEFLQLSSRGLGSSPATTFLTADLENYTEPGTPGVLMPLQHLVNPCVSLRLYKYMQCYPLFLVLPILCNNQSENAPFHRGKEPWNILSHWSKADFSQHHTTKAVRNLAFSYTPAVMQTPNACMTTLAVNSNEKPTKTTSPSSVPAFLQLFLNRQATYAYIIATSACTDISYKWETPLKHSVSIYPIEDCYIN